MKCSTTLLEKTSASPQRNMKRSPVSSMQSSTAYAEMVEALMLTNEKYLSLCSTLIQELAQYKDIEEEEDQLKRIIGV